MFPPNPILESAPYAIPNPPRITMFGVRRSANPILGAKFRFCELPVALFEVQSSLILLAAKSASKEGARGTAQP